MTKRGNRKHRIAKFIMLIVALIMVDLIYIHEKSLAAPFGYNVGDTFVVEGYTFKIVDKDTRQAVATSVLTTANYYTISGVAAEFAGGFANRNSSYISSSGLPRDNDYNNPTWRVNVGNLNTLWEWTLTQQSYFYLASSEGVLYDYNGFNHNSYYGVRPVLYLKSGLSITGPGGTLSADTTPPTCTITANPTADPTNAISITYTFTFSEPVTGFDTTDITVTNGTKGTFTVTSTSVYTLVVTNTGSVTQTVSVAAGRCTDLAGNNNTAASKSVTIDRTAPTAAITYSPVGPYKSGTVVTITATFSEVMKDSPIPRIAISGANTLAATNMTKTSTTVYRYTYTVGAGNGTATVALSTGQDNVGNVVTSSPTSGETFTVDNTPPTNPTFVATPNNSTPTNGNVTVTITYSGDSTIRQYKIDSGAWTNYTTAVVMTANGTIYARAADAVGNENTSASLSVYNIDKIAPVAPTSNLASGLYNTSQSLTLSGEAGATIRYTTDGNNPTTLSTTYTSPLTISTTTTLKVMQWDAAGNVSPVATYTYTIDTEAPTAPEFITTPSITIPTKNDIVVTIHSWGDATKREYKITVGGVVEIDWTDYTTDLVIDKNCTIYAKGTDTAGNESGESALSITKIDKMAPEITLTPSIIILTNQNITVTASITDNISGVEVKKWASGNQQVNYFNTNGTTLDTSFEVSENGTYTVYAKDIAGNETVQIILIGNIDKEAPGVPEFLPSTTLPTDKVTVTIKFPDGSHTKEYKLSDGIWENYTEPLVIDKNITIYAKCADIVGNTTGETSLNIGNIEVNGSVEGIELDDRKHFRYYLGLGRNGITQCMLVAGNENGKVKHPFLREDIIDSTTNRFRDGIFYIDIYGKIKRY